jgi:hypothetical protein
VYLYGVSKIGLGSFSFILDVIADKVERFTFENHEINAAISAYNKATSTFDFQNVHLNYCNQAEYEGTCKYGDDDCPALEDK